MSGWPKKQDSLTSLFLRTRNQTSPLDAWDEVAAWGSPGGESFDAPGEPSPNDQTTLVDACEPTNEWGWRSSELQQQHQPTDQEWGFNTIVHNAAAGHDLAMLEQALASFGDLIDAADPNNDGWTPLLVAAWNGRVSAIELLVGLGSNAIDTPNNNGRTPLHEAASNGHVSVIETLVRLGSKAVDTPDDNGWTPMYEAASNGYVSVIELLVRLGSNAFDIPDNEGRTPLDIATSDCSVLLRSLAGTWQSQPSFSFLPPTEEEVAEIRFRVYFAQPLVHRLLVIPFAHDEHHKDSFQALRLQPRMAQR